MAKNIFVQNFFCTIAAKVFRETIKWLSYCWHWEWPCCKISIRYGDG